MAILKKEDIDVIRLLMTSNEAKTKDYVVQELHKYYPGAVVESEKFILAFGTLPIALVAHMDTVEEFHKDNAIMVYDQEQEILTTIGTYGYDDKLGVFSILKLVKMGYRPSLIFCCSEEVGGLGASDLVKRYPQSPFPDLKYMLEIDRAGYNNFVTYTNGDPELRKYIESVTTYVHDVGSFSDVEIIGPVWKIGYLNASCAYYQEHTSNEHVMVDEWYDQFNQWRCLLELSNDAPYFKYVEDPTGGWGEYYPTYTYTESCSTSYCDECGTTEGSDHFVPALDEKGQPIYLCEKCASRLVSYCPICGTPFVPEGPDEDICPICKKEIGSNYDIFDF